MNHLIFKIGLLCGGALFAACSLLATPPLVTNQGTGAAPAVAKPSRAICRGMTGDEVIQRIGKPNEIKPIESPEGSAEVWVYHRMAGRVSQETITSMHPVPAFNRVGASSMSFTNANDPSGAQRFSPQSGAVGMIQEPSYSNEIVELQETTSFLIFKGKCVGWKRVVEKKRSFD